MKRFCMGIALTTAILGGTAFCGDAKATTAACSVATLNGAYGVALSGVDASGATVSAVFYLKADGKGHITGNGTQNSNGTLNTVSSLTATYTVTAGCSGTIVTGGGETYAFVLEKGNTEFQIALVTTKDGLKGGIGAALGTSVCKASGVQGVFGGASIPQSASSTATVGQSTYDGKGGVTATASVLAPASKTAPTTPLTVKSTGTYTVDAHCLSSQTANYKVYFNNTIQVASGTSHGLGILVENGTKILSISGDAGSSVATALQK